MHFILLLHGVGHIKDQIDNEEETHYHFMGYTFWLAVKDLLYTPSYRQDIITVHTTDWNGK